MAFSARCAVTVTECPLLLFPVSLLHHLLSPQLHVVVSKNLVQVVVDCKPVGEKPINASANITSDGVEVLGRMVRAEAPGGNSAPVSRCSSKPEWWPWERPWQYSQREVWQREGREGDKQTKIL